MNKSLNNDFLNEIDSTKEKRERIDNLIKAYKKQTPNVSPIWDTTSNSIQHNNINSKILSAGLDIYSASYDEIWEGIFEPKIYDKASLWTNHDNRKIVQVIEAWENKRALSPLFFVKHGSKDKALVADGKHRLTVARYMGCDTIPFMVQSNNSSWIKLAIPAAKLVLNTS